MSKISKYDSFMNELVDLEKAVYAFHQKYEILESENESLTEQLAKLENENVELKKKIVNLEAGYFENEKTGNFLGDKEDLKEKISELISKIDYHLRS